jgi:hypothetical protein
MKAKHSTVVAVHMPHDLRTALEDIAAAKGETLSVIVRDLVRQAAVGALREPSGGVAPPSSRNFK